MRGGEDHPHRVLLAESWQGLEKLLYRLLSFADPHFTPKLHTLRDFKELKYVLFVIHNAARDPKEGLGLRFRTPVTLIRTAISVRAGLYEGSLGERGENLAWLEELYNRDEVAICATRWKEGQ